MVESLPSFVRIVIMAIEAIEHATPTVGWDITCLTYPMNPNPPQQNIKSTKKCPTRISFTTRVLHKRQLTKFDEAQSTEIDG